MSKDVAKRSASGLDSLASKIRKEHEACERNAQSAVEHAIKAGELLTIAKAKVKHGGWGGWLAENFPGSQWVANSYMRLCRERDQIGDASTISSALAALAEPRDTEPPKTPELPTKTAPDPEPSDPDDEAEVVDGEVVEDDSQDVPVNPDPGPSVECPTCGHMVRPEDIGTWDE